MLKAGERKESFARVLKLLKADKKLIDLEESRFVEEVKARLLELSLELGVMEAMERISEEVKRWLNFFERRMGGLILLSKCYEKAGDKGWFVEIFLSSSIFRECLKTILSYPYLCRILFEEIEILKRVFENSFIDEISECVNSLKSRLNDSRYFLGEEGWKGEDAVWEVDEKLSKEFYKHLGVYGVGGGGDGKGEELGEELLERLNFRSLNSFKRVQILRIGCLKGMGVYNIEDVGRRLSAVGDLILGKVLERERKLLERRLGKQDGLSIAVIGLNNYALHKLTYTDKYDILFVYENVVKGEVGGDAWKRGLKFKDALIEHVIDFLMPKGEEALYNLNYHKKSKRSNYPLNKTTKGYIDYIENENIVHRYDLINMRYIGGDKSLGIYFINALRRLVYRKYLSTEEVKEHERLIGSIFKSFSKKPIKTIDKIINLLCMLYAKGEKEGNKKNVRCKLEEIVEHGFMSESECEAVFDSYTFLKELKYQRELYDFRDWSYFFSNLDTIKENKLTIYTLLLSKGSIREKGVSKDIEGTLRALFNEVIYATERIFRKYIKVFVDKRSYLITLLYLREDESEYGMEGFLKELGFADAVNAIRSIREISNVQQMGKEKYVETLVLLFELVEKEKSLQINIDKILFYFLKLLECYGILDSLFVLLIEYPQLLLRLTTIFSKSIFLSELLISHPQYLEEVGDEVFVYSKPTDKLLEEEFKGFSLGNSFNDAIKELKAYESLRLGLQQLLNLEVEELGKRLTELSEFILLKTFNYYHGASSKKLGYKSEEYGLVMLGKLGGYEMSFGSDLDIYLVYNEREDIGEGYDSNMFYKVVLNALNGFFAKAISYGGLYELDLKLRPEGRNAPITVSYKKLKDYLLEGRANKERVWERLLYTKARIYSPNVEFKEALEVLIRDFVLPKGGLEVGDDELKEEVLVMRERISKNALKKGKGSRGKGSRYLFKKGRGGLLDIEFLVEYLILRMGNMAYLPNNTYKSLKKLFKEGVIRAEDYKVLLEGLRFYRELEGLLRIEENVAIEDLSYGDGEKILELAYCFNFKNANDFICYCHDNISKVANVFDDYLCKNKLY